MNNCPRHFELFDVPSFSSITARDDLRVRWSIDSAWQRESLRSEWTSNELTRRKYFYVTAFSQLSFFLFVFSLFVQEEKSSLQKNDEVERSSSFARSSGEENLSFDPIIDWQTNHRDPFVSIEFPLRLQCPTTESLSKEFQVENWKEEEDEEEEELSSPSDRRLKLMSVDNWRRKLSLLIRLIKWRNKPSNNNDRKRSFADDDRRTSEREREKHLWRTFHYWWCHGLLLSASRPSECLSAADVWSWTRPRDSLGQRSQWNWPGFCRGNSKWKDENQKSFSADAKDRLRSAADLREKSDRIRRRIRANDAREGNVDGVGRHSDWNCLWRAMKRTSRRRVPLSTSPDRWEDKPKVRRWTASFNIESTELVGSEEYRSYQHDHHSSLLFSKEKTANVGAIDGERNEKGEKSCLLVCHSTSSFSANVSLILFFWLTIDDVTQ